MDWSPRNPAKVGAVRILTASNESDFSGRTVGGRVVLGSGSERLPLWTIPGDINAARQTGEPERFVTTSEISVYSSIDRNHSLLAYTTETAHFDQTFVENLATRKRRPVASTGLHQYYNILNSQGTRILFGSSTPTGFKMFVTSLSGSEPALICEGCTNASGWSTDDKYILFGGIIKGRSVTSVYELETKTNTPIIEHPEGGIQSPKLSPDGREIAFFLSKPGEPRTLQIAPFEGKKPIPANHWVTIPVPHSFVSNPIWSPDGRWIYYLAGEIDQPDSTLLAARRWDRAARKPAGDEVVFYRFNRSLRPYNNPSNTPAAATDRIFMTMNEMRRDVWLLDPAAR